MIAGLIGFVVGFVVGAILAHARIAELEALLAKAASEERPR